MKQSTQRWDYVNVRYYSHYSHKSCNPCHFLEPNCKCCWLFRDHLHTGDVHQMLKLKTKDSTKVERLWLIYFVLQELKDPIRMQTGTLPISPTQFRYIEDEILSSRPHSESKLVSHSQHLRATTLATNTKKCKNTQTNWYTTKSVEKSHENVLHTLL